MVLAVGPPLGRGPRGSGLLPSGPRCDSTSTRVEDPAPGETADERHRLLPPTHGDVAEDVDGVVRADDGVPVRDQHGVHLADAVERTAAVPDDVLVTEVQVGGLPHLRRSELSIWLRFGAPDPDDSALVSLTAFADRDADWGADRDADRR